MSIEAKDKWLNTFIGRRKRNRGDAQPAPVVESWAWEARPSRKATPLSFPRFQATASNHLDGQPADRFAGIRLKLAEAFTPSNPITDRRMFAGRAEVLTKLISAIEGQRLHTIVYGERGIGKTSLLHVLGQAAAEARYLVVYISCGAASEFDETVRSIAEHIPLLFHKDYGPTHEASEKGASFASLLPAGAVSVRAASELFAAVVGTRVLVLMDEFDRTNSVEFHRNMAEFMKNLSDRAVRVQFVISGAAANVSEFVSHIPGIRRNVFALQLPPMTADEIHDLIKNGEEASSVSFEPTAIEFIAQVTNGLPYVATLLSYHAGLAAADGARTVITPGDVSAAISEAMSELNGRMSRRVQAQLTNGILKGLHKSLGRLARETLAVGGQFADAEIDALHRNPEAAARCRSLIDSFARDGGLLEISEDELGRRYRFVEESIPAYLWLLEAQETFLSSQGAAQIRAPDPQTSAKR